MVRFFWWARSSAWVRALVLVSMSVRMMRCLLFCLMRMVRRAS